MKNKFVSFLIINVLLVTNAGAQNRSIIFSTKPFEEVLSEAGTKNKLVFMDAYASWCGPCKWMSANIFTNDTIADYFNSNFICVKYDMEKGEGINLSQIYQVRAYPTLLFINSKGDLVHKRVGAPQTIAEYLEMGRKAMSPDENFSALQKKYSKGDRTPEFLYSYLKVLSEAYMPTDAVLARYFSGINTTELITNSNWKLLYAYLTDMDSPEFQYLIKHQKEFERVHGQDSVNGKIANVYLRAMTGIAEGGTINDTAYQSLKKKIIASGFSGSGKLLFDADLSIYQMKGDIPSFLELAYRELDKYYPEDPSMLNNVAWLVHEISKDRKYLEKALQWAKKSVELKPASSNNDTYAALLYDLGKKEEAIKYCKTALALAKQNKEDFAQIEEHLAKYQSGQ